MNETFYGASERVEFAKWPFGKKTEEQRLLKKASRMKQMFLELMRESYVKTQKRAWPLYNVLTYINTCWNRFVMHQQKLV